MAIIERTAPDGNFYQIEALERTIGAQAPYFSVTCLMWEPRGKISGKARARNGRDCDAGGAMHEEIAALVPELIPVIAVHLSDANGAPMHAKANGWYFYNGAASTMSDHERAAKCLHIDPENLPESLDEAAFYAFVDSLAPFYAQQAETARQIIARFDTEGATR